MFNVFVYTRNTGCPKCLWQILRINVKSIFIYVILIRFFKIKINITFVFISFNFLCYILKNIYVMHKGKKSKLYVIWDFENIFFFVHFEQSQKFCAPFKIINKKKDLICWKQCVVVNYTNNNW